MAGITDCVVYCGSSILATLGVVYLINKLLSSDKTKPPKLTTPKLTKGFPKNKVLLNQAGRGKYAPSLSPFPIKLETYLRMAKIPYENAKEFQFSSKGKTPWIQYNDEEIADSQVCIEFLNKEFGVDLDRQLSSEQKAIARALLKMTEENLYWSLVWYRWDECKGDGVMELSGGAFPRMFIKELSKRLSDQVWKQGFGRHTRDEKLAMTRGDLEALSDYLGDKAYIMGDTPCELDCAIFGMLAQIYWHFPGSPALAMMTTNFKNLVDYCYRMKEKFWPDWDECILSPDTETKKEL